VAYAKHPQPVQVLKSIRLGQLNVPYDSGDTEYNDLTDYGFGGWDLETLTGDDCKGGSARLGATGDLSPGDYVNADRGWPIGKGNRDFAAMHYHSAFWRVDFDIDGKGREKVEQFDTKVDGRGEMAPRLTTTPRPCG
jgi:hypothetical protein